jgi:hypothetical protein
LLAELLGAAILEVGKVASATAAVTDDAFGGFAEHGWRAEDLGQMAEVPCGCPLCLCSEAAKGGELCFSCERGRRPGGNSATPEGARLRIAAHRSATLRRQPLLRTP